MKKNLSIVTAVLFFAVFAACKQNSNSIPDAAQLTQVDRDFSLYSIKHGMKKAFLEFADSAVVLLRQNNYPIEGKKSLREIMKNVPTANFNCQLLIF